MVTKILVPAYIMAQNNNDVLAITGFQPAIVEDKGSVFYIEFTKDLSAAEKTTMSTNITSKDLSSKVVT